MFASSSYPEMPLERRDGKSTAPPLSPFKQFPYSPQNNRSPRLSSLISAQVTFRPLPQDKVCRDLLKPRLEDCAEERRSLMSIVTLSVIL
jgi:hypothetical protein